MQQVLNDNPEDTSILSCSLSHAGFLFKSRLILLQCLLQCSVSFSGQLSLYELLIHVLTGAVRFLCFRFGFYGGFGNDCEFHWECRHHSYFTNIEEKKSAPL